MNNFKIFFLSIITFLLFFCTVSCGSGSLGITVMEYDGKFPDESVRNVEIIMSEDGQISFVLSAPLMNKYYGDDPYMDFPEGISVSSYSNGRINSTLTADYAIDIERTQLKEAHGNVVIVDLVKEETILTEKLIWDQKKKQIYSDVEITQIKADGTVNKGDGIDSDEKFTKYSIKNPRGEILAEDL